MLSAVASLFARLTAGSGATSTQPAIDLAETSFSGRPADPTGDCVPGRPVTERSATLVSSPRPSVGDQKASAASRISPLLVGGFDVPSMASKEDKARLQAGDAKAAGAQDSAPIIPFNKATTREFWCDAQGLERLAAQLRMDAQGPRLLGDLLNLFIRWASLGSTKMADVRTAAEILKSALQSPLATGDQPKPGFNAFGQAKQRLCDEVAKWVMAAVVSGQTRPAGSVFAKLDAAAEVFKRADQADL